MRTIFLIPALFLLLSACQVKVDHNDSSSKPSEPPVLVEEELIEESDNPEPVFVEPPPSLAPAETDLPPPSSVFRGRPQGIVYINIDPFDSSPGTYTIDLTPLATDAATSAEASSFSVRSNSFGLYELTPLDDISFPVQLTVEKWDTAEAFSTLIFNDNPGLHINAITNWVVSHIGAEEVTEARFNQIGQNLVTRLFGEGIDFSIFTEQMNSNLIVHDSFTVPPLISKLLLDLLHLLEVNLEEFPEHPLFELKTVRTLFASLIAYHYPADEFKDAIAPIQSFLERWEVEPEIMAFYDIQQRAQLEQTEIDPDDQRLIWSTLLRVIHSALEQELMAPALKGISPDKAITLIANLVLEDIITVFAPGANINIHILIDELTQLLLHAIQPLNCQCETPRSLADIETLSMTVSASVGEALSDAILFAFTLDEDDFFQDFYLNFSWLSEDSEEYDSLFRTDQGGRLQLAHQHNWSSNYPFLAIAHPPNREALLTIIFSPSHSHALLNPVSHEAYKRLPEGEISFERLQQVGQDFIDQLLGAGVSFLPFYSDASFVPIGDTTSDQPPSITALLLHLLEAEATDFQNLPEIPLLENEETQKRFALLLKLYYPDDTILLEQLEHLALEPTFHDAILQHSQIVLSDLETEPTDSLLRSKRVFNLLSAPALNLSNPSWAPLSPLEVDYPLIAALLVSHYQEEALIQQQLTSSLVTVEAEENLLRFSKAFLEVTTEHQLLSLHKKTLRTILLMIAETTKAQSTDSLNTEELIFIVMNVAGVVMDTLFEQFVEPVTFTQIPAQFNLSQSIAPHRSKQLSIHFEEEGSPFLSKNPPSTSILIEDQETWESGLTQAEGEGSIHLENPEAHTHIDFEQYNIVLLMSEFPSSGFSYQVQEVFEDSDRIVVYGALSSPGKNCGVLTVVSFEGVLLQLPKTDKPVYWSFKEAPHSCAGSF